ncbi:polysaccharide deacetylase family protein [Ectobacillus panaciterrae]|uniref:polysaccharide deacetylase family protein n=1 Tax=Ectobacillus panaciterrae TaxID=363872 RepID=UPI000423C2EB|nr:polysaccharide deacetylase family protein [Ectobacillus panaciterrae]
MKKVLMIVLLSSLALTGCNTTIAKLKREEKPSQTAVKSEPEPEPKPVIVTQGIVTWDPITYESKSTTLYIKDLKDTFTEVQYHVWRMADGTGSKKVFSSKDRANNFALPLSLQAFDFKRGEYQIETVGLKEDNQQVPLAKSAITFQQYVPILMYHGIDEYHGHGIKSLFVSPAKFEAQMKYLKDNGYTLLTFENWSDINKVNKPIFITFDDGLKDNINALAIFQKLKDDHFQPTATEYLFPNALNTPGFLTTDDVKMMANSGIFSVQSHTLNHANLPFVPNMEEEIRDSKTRIEEITGKPVISIAYPVGLYDDRVVETTKKYYQFAVTTNKGQFIEKNKPNEYLLMERVGVFDFTTLDQFIASVREKK